jgi:hypothetical protein
MLLYWYYDMNKLAIEILETIVKECDNRLLKLPTTDARAHTLAHVSNKLNEILQEVVEVEIDLSMY